MHPANPRSSSSWKIGKEREDVRQVLGAVVGIVEHDHVAGLPLGGRQVARQHRLQRGAHGVEVRRDARALGDDAPARVEERRREVQDVADQRRVGRALDRGRHLLADGVERVADDLHRERVDGDASHARS
jgi:hypothetical protein